MVDHTSHRLRPADVELDLVADAVAILEVDAQPGQVVVHLVLPADREARAEEAGARDEERRIERQHVEQHDHGDEPDHDRREVAHHPRRSIDALTATLLAGLTRSLPRPAVTGPATSRARSSRR